MFKKFFNRDYTVPTFEETNNPNRLDLEEDTDDKSDSSPAYQVGITVDNRITLRIGDNFSAHTLTMNPPGVRKLIRMLEAAIDPDKEEYREEE